LEKRHWLAIFNELLQEARERIAHDNCRSRGGDRHAAADEETGTDDAADGDHRYVARPQ
jgi:hypothetical protein